METNECAAYLLLFAVLLVVPLLGSDSPKEYDDKTETDDMQGTWKDVETQANVLTCDSGTWTLDNGDGDPWRGTYRIIDNRHNPARFDRFYTNGLFKGTTANAIYQVDGDTLRIAGFSSKLHVRPQGFNDEGVIVGTYKRVRK